MKLVKYFTLSVFAMFLVSCTGRQGGTLTGAIRIDGSSTVYPITEAIAEEYRLEQPRVRITIGVSGTGGGFQKFTRGEIDINNASRPIKDPEAQAVTRNEGRFVALRVAYDGLAVLVHKDNTWVDHFTVDELKKMWEPSAQGNILRWNQIRPEWPDEEFHLYGPGVASGTYDYFTEVIVGESGASRGDYTASEDDNVLVQGISGDRNGIGFFGYAYYAENQDKVRLVGVDGGQGVVLPSPETVTSGAYAPLSRPVFIYVSDSAARRPEVADFVNFYLEVAAEIVPDVGYIPLPSDEYQEEMEKFSTFIGQ
ncbi:MAG: PstS family phosphate ABC transporter substrate-binding protein [Cyclobacteriaceae bacterium]|jgi:phosphate transport system substrate-binding protein|nr:PstS family phosphate ABC transporter substrate-binding protein [Cyclobacteriaceae bacterium]